MNDILKDRLSALDEISIQAIKAVFDENIEKEMPAVYNDDDLQLGQRYRAYMQAKDIIEQSFKDIQSYKVTKTLNTSFNKAI